MISLTSSTLNHLIKVCKDGEQGFQTAAKHVTDLQLRTIFLDKATHFQDFIHDLQEYSFNLKEIPEDHSHMTGALYRGWMNLKSVFTDHKNQEMLNQCERGITMALSAYKDILVENLTIENQRLIQRHYDIIFADHVHICDLISHYKIN